MFVYVNAGFIRVKKLPVSISTHKALSWGRFVLPTMDVADVTAVSTEEVVAGLKEALSAGTEMALEQFQGAIENMTLEDAEGILQGPEDAATQYFRKHSEAALREQFLPIVRETTSSAGVTSSYQSIMKQLGSYSSFFQPKSLDIDEYVTDEALNGLFEMVSQEEKRIRQDPVARSSELLKRVFGSSS